MTFVATIRIENKRVRNIFYHNSRFNKTRRRHFEWVKDLSLRPFIRVPHSLSGRVKCRVIYDENVINIEYAPYTVLPTLSLKLRHADHISYTYKTVDRAALDHLYDTKNGCDDILIVKKGFVTDTYYANVAFLKNDCWYTPSTPLLQGSMRHFLLSKGRIIKKNIPVEDIYQYESIAIFNAMIPFGEKILPTSSIFP